MHLFWNRMRFGRSRSAKVFDFGTNRQGICDFLLVIIIIRLHHYHGEDYCFCQYYYSYYYYYSFFFLSKRSLADKHETCTGMDPKCIATGVLLLFTLKVIFTGRYFLLLLKYFFQATFTFT